jgi:hypothetical protein
VPRELLDEPIDRGAELARRHHLRHEAECERLVGADPAAAHDEVLGAAQSHEPSKPLRPAGAGDHPDRHLRETELEVVGGEAKVAGERELEPNSEAVALERRDHRLGAALGGGDVVRKPRDVPRRSLEEARDVASGGECTARAAQDDEPNALVSVELLEHAAELVARVHGDAIEFAGHVERDGRDAALGVVLDPEPVVLAHSLSRSMRRRIFPDGLFGSSGTNRYSRGRLNLANVSEARQ